VLYRSAYTEWLRLLRSFIPVAAVATDLLPASANASNTCLAHDTGNCAAPATETRPSQGLHESVERRRRLERSASPPVVLPLDMTDSRSSQPLLFVPSSRRLASDATATNDFICVLQLTLTLASLPISVSRLENRRCLHGYPYVPPASSQLRCPFARGPEGPHCIFL